MGCDQKGFAICQYDMTVADPPKPLIFDNPIVDLLTFLSAGRVVGYYVHPMNSVGACVSYCGARDTANLIFLDELTCACSKGTWKFFIVICH